MNLKLFRKTAYGNKKNWLLFPTIEYPFDDVMLHKIIYEGVLLQQVLTLKT
jgi:hypothetical protein